MFEVLGSLFTGGNALNTLGTIGGLLGAGTSYGGLQRSAEDLEKAGREASELAKFKPYSVKTGTATTMFDPEARTATYALDPRVKAMQDFLYGQTEKARAGLEQLDPQAYAAEVLAEQRALQDPLRQAEDIALANQLRATGRIGLGVSPQALGGGMLGGAINPEKYRLDLARARADAEAAATARELGVAEQQRRQKELADLFGGATGIEKFGTEAMDTAARYGTAAAQAGAQAGNLLMEGLVPSAESRLSATTGLSEFIPEFARNIGGLFGKEQQPLSALAAPAAFTPSYSLYGAPSYSAPRVGLFR